VVRVEEVLVEAVLLTDKRAELRDRLLSGRYRSIPGILLDGMAVLFGKISLSRWRIPDWASAILITLLTLLAGLLISVLAGERICEAGSCAHLNVSLWSAAFGPLILVTNNVLIKMFTRTFSGRILEYFQSEADLEDFEAWLDHTFTIKAPLAFGLVVGSILGVYLVLVWHTVNPGESLTIGSTMIVVLSSIQSMMAVYYLYPFYLAFPARMSHYRFDLFVVDPSSSEVTKELSDLFTSTMYITVSLVVLVTIGFWLTGFFASSTLLFLAVVVWVPTVFLYVGSQFHLSRLINRTKWETLARLQASIERLHCQEEIPSKERLEYIEKLLNYHDRIKNTPNSALNLRAGLNFLTSLLFPVIALILSNFEEIRNLLGLSP
jgi:ABC-type multidrug transport system fused ATPase/permease subunit